MKIKKSKKQKISEIKKLQKVNIDRMLDLLQSQKDDLIESKFHNQLYFNLNSERYS